MSNLQAAIGLAQLERLRESVDKKRWIGRKYNNNLGGLDELIQLPIQKCRYAENIYWVFGIVLKKGSSLQDANEMMSKLNSYGIGSRPFFWPLHKQPVLKRLNLKKLISYPVAENISQNGFYIPSGLGINEEEINRTSEGLKGVLLSSPRR